MKAKEDELALLKTVLKQQEEKTKSALEELNESLGENEKNNAESA